MRCATSTTETSSTSQTGRTSPQRAATATTSSGTSWRNVFSDVFSRRHWQTIQAGSTPTEEYYIDTPFYAYQRHWRRSPRHRYYICPLLLQRQEFALLSFVERSRYYGLFTVDRHQCRAHNRLSLAPVLSLQLWVKRWHLSPDYVQVQTSLIHLHPGFNFPVPPDPRLKVAIHVERDHK